MEHRYKRSKSEPDLGIACATVKSVIGLWLAYQQPDLAGIHCFDHVQPPCPCAVVFCKTKDWAEKKNQQASEKSQAGINSRTTVACKWIWRGRLRNRGLSTPGLRASQRGSWHWCLISHHQPSMQPFFTIFPFVCYACFCAKEAEERAQKEEEEQRQWPQRVAHRAGAAWWARRWRRRQREAVYRKRQREKLVQWSRPQASSSCWTCWTSDYKDSRPFGQLYNANHTYVISIHTYVILCV